jgi:hypothetical protein
VCPLASFLEALAVRLPRVRFSVRAMMIVVAVLAVVLAATMTVADHLGPKDGGYIGIYRYLGTDGKWHVVRGNVIFVKDGMIFVD